jgi:S1-C subfamily serine protease
MDIKDLNKQQLILLAVLLSFVTSIATGIVTVTLMQQAPPSVTLPINRVIQQTVEKIQQVEGKTTVQTVVVKEEDLVVDAISKNKPTIYSISREGADAGHGFTVNSDGIIVADAVLVHDSGTYILSNAGKTYKAKFLYDDPAGFSFLKLMGPVEGTDAPAINVPTFGDFSKMKTGQKLILLGNTPSSFIYDGDPDIKISISRGNAGGEVFNLDGEVLGISLFNEINPFTSINKIKASLEANATKLQ